MEIPGEGEFHKPNFLKESIALKWNFQRGWGVQAKKNLPWERYGYFLKQHICLKTTLPYNKPWYYFRISNQEYLAWMANSNAGFRIPAPTNTMQIQESSDAPAEFYSKVPVRQVSCQFMLCYKYSKFQFCSRIF